MKKAALSLLLVALVGGFASAEMLSVECAPASGAGGESLILSDISVDTAGADWLSSLCYIELDSGSLYQNNVVPSMPWARITNENDSFLADYVSIPAGTNGNELATQPGMSGDPANADVSLCFIAALPEDDVPPWNGLALRLALTDDASGVGIFQVSVEGQGQTRIPLMVKNGCVSIVPEPGTIALVLCGLIGLCVLRRK